MNVLRLLKIIIPVWSTVFILAAGDNFLEINTKYGRVRGITQNPIFDKVVDAFLGIPYGSPTDGENRFGPPKEVKPWNGVFDATKLPGPCYQVIGNEFKNNVVASSGEETEDCLKLNVWVPKPRPRKSPVMVWIHGGGFTCGSTDIPLYNGAILAAQENIIMVSLNYRLSGFGFLYLDHPLAPGNVGLMDQALGLEWVKKNIELFGGDPEKVTIFGESAGGASVGFHLIIPSSLDLFQNGILQSGTANSIWTTHEPKEAFAQSMLIAERAGCPVQERNREETIRCLQVISADQLLKVMLTVEDKPLKMVIKPVVDGTYLPDQPSDLLNKGKFCGEKNVLIGFTKEDGSFALPVFASHLQITEDSVYTENEIRHIMSYATKHNENLTDLQVDIVKFMYTDWDSLSEDRIAARKQLIHFLTDRWGGCPSIHMANKMSDKGNKVFLFRFDHILENQTAFVKLPKWAGSTHGDELPFVFGHALKNNEGEEARLAKQVMRYWANFARQGDPNDGYLQNWPQYNTQQKLRIQMNGGGLTVDRIDRLKECAFWEEIFPKTDLLMKTDH